MMILISLEDIFHAQKPCKSVALPVPLPPTFSRYTTTHQVATVYTIQLSSIFKGLAVAE
jgi:hypothetical protein